MHIVSQWLRQTSIQQETCRRPRRALIRDGADKATVSFSMSPQRHATPSRHKYWHATLRYIAFGWVYAALACPSRLCYSPPLCNIESSVSTALATATIWLLCYCVALFIATVVAALVVVAWPHAAVANIS